MHEHCKSGQKGRFTVKNVGLLLLPLLALLLSGCASTGAGFTATWQTLFGAHEPDQKTLRAVHEPALLVNAEGQQRIYSLGARSGTRAYWHSGYPVRVLSTREGRLNSTGGFQEQLIDLVYDYSGWSPWRRPLDELPAYYRATAYLRNASGQERMLQGRAVLRCKAHVSTLELPLAQRPAFECLERIEWNDKMASFNHFWRDARGHILRVEQAPWPDAPEISWEVIRPWW